MRMDRLRKRGERTAERAALNRVSKQISRWEAGMGGGVESVGSAWRCRTFIWHCKKCATKQSLAAPSFTRDGVSTLRCVFPPRVRETEWGATPKWVFRAPVWERLEVLYYHARVSACVSVFVHACVALGLMPLSPCSNPSPTLPLPIQVMPSVGEMCHPSAPSLRVSSRGN